MTPPARWADTVYAPPAALRPWRVEELYPGRGVRYFSFGRRALAAALRAAGVRAGDSVLVPGFICRDVLSAVAAAGAAPAFYAVDERLRPAEPPERWPRAAAVLAVDYFGYPQDLAPFQAYAEKTGAVVVEDNAHGLFSRDEAGRPLGARAPFGVLSLRKSLTLPNGAALLAEPGRPLPEQEPFAEAASLRGRAKSAFRGAVPSLGARSVLSLLETVRAARAGRRLEPPPEAGAACEVELPEPSLPCAELSRPLVAGDPGLEVERRRALHALIERELAPRGFAPHPGPLPPGTAPYAYAYRASGARVAEAERLLTVLGLRSLPWPDLPAAVAPGAPAHYRDVRLAHFLW